MREMIRVIIFFYSNSLSRVLGPNFKLGPKQIFMFAYLFIVKNQHEAYIEF
jgi:hypothetical protein